jgi:hypothetical protein
VKIAFTPTIAKKLIKRAKNNFRRHPYAPPNWKDIFDQLHVFVAINEGFSSNAHAMAMSWMLNDYYGKRYGIDPSFAKTKVGKTDWWLCIEFQAKIVCEADGPSLFNLVAHELSHSLDYVIRGKMQDTNEKSHDEFFCVLMSFMGGAENYRFPHKSGLNKRIQSSIDSFGGISIVS